jgi:hypothetical protein
MTGTGIPVRRGGHDALRRTDTALQFVLAGQAARNNGRRFVTTVLAIKASQGP